MSNIHLIHSQHRPRVHACGTCLHRRRDKCDANGFYITISRSYEHLCGPKGRQWEAMPPSPPKLPKGPRVGLVPWLREILFGSQRAV